MHPCIGCLQARNDKFTLTSKEIHLGRHTHPQTEDRSSSPVSAHTQCARAHTHSSAASPATTAVWARPTLRRGAGRGEGTGSRARAGGGAHLGSAPGRGRRSVVSASGRTWLGCGPGGSCGGGGGGGGPGPGASAAQPSPSERGTGARSPDAAMVEAAPPGPGPLRRTFLVPEIKSLDQYDFSRAKAAASLAWVLRAAFGGAGTRPGEGGRQVRGAGRRAGEAGAVGTIAPAAGGLGPGPLCAGPLGFLLRRGHGLCPPGCGSRVGVGPAAQLLAGTRAS